MTTEPPIARERTDKRITVSMSVADHDRIAKIAKITEAYTASEVIRDALRAYERQLAAGKGKKGKR